MCMITMIILNVEELGSHTHTASSPALNPYSRRMSLFIVAHNHSTTFLVYEHRKNTRDKDTVITAPSEVNHEHKR